jgi:hypothetical protein
MMAEPHIVFEPQKIGDEWQIRAHCPEGQLRYIAGFKSKAEAEAWSKTIACRVWRAKEGYLK